MEDQTIPDTTTQTLEALSNLSKDLEILKLKDINDIKTAIKILNSKIDNLSIFETQSKSIGEITEALNKAKIEVPGLSASGKGNRGEYSTIDDISGTFWTPLANNGLDMKFSVWETAKGESYLIGILTHTSGEWFKSVQKLVPEEKTITANGYNQAFKAATTYAKRNIYEAMMGV